MKKGHERPVVTKGYGVGRAVGTTEKNGHGVV